MNSVIAAIIAAVRIFMILAFAWLPSDFRFANDILADILELHLLSKSASKNVMTDNVHIELLQLQLCILKVSIVQFFFNISTPTTLFKPNLAQKYRLIIVRLS